MTYQIIDDNRPPASASHAHCNAMSSLPRRREGRGTTPVMMT